MPKGVWRDVKGGIGLRLRVMPNARKNAIAGIYTDANGEMSLKVTTTAQPEKGKANKAVIALLAKQLGCAKSALEVTAGQSQRNKTVVIKGDSRDIERWLIPILEKIENA